jgi:hypothetical protein
MFSQERDETVRDVDRALRGVLGWADFHTAVIRPLDMPGDVDLLAKEEVHIRHAQRGCLPRRRPPNAHTDECGELIVSGADHRSHFLGSRDRRRRRRLALPGQPGTIGHIARHAPVAGRRRG